MFCRLKAGFLLLSFGSVFTLGLVGCKTTINSRLGIIYRNENRLYKDGKEFQIWGLNYGAGEEGLTESFWRSQSRWEEQIRDFKEMRELGANCVRLHLQTHEYFIDKDSINHDNLKKLKQLIKVAEINRLYVIITGLGAYKKEEQPDWYASLKNEERMVIQEKFWEEISKAVGGSRSVIGYDLMNEPVVSSSLSESWTPGKDLAGYYYVQNVAKGIDTKDHGKVMETWVKRMTASIQKHDTCSFITVGLLPFKAYKNLSPLLSTMSIHLYPEINNPTASSDLIDYYSQGGNPLIISEIFPLNGTAESIEKFIVENNHKVSGWIWHYSGTPPEKIKGISEKDIIWKSALEKFRSMSDFMKKDNSKK